MRACMPRIPVPAVAPHRRIVEPAVAVAETVTGKGAKLAHRAARGAKALLEAGFTSVYGASEAKLRLGVAVRNEVNAGRIPGPRIRAGGLEISVTGAIQPMDS